ncbi:MAG TPA: ABC transporter substrate-binding protein [Clostridia bacterium]|nr:ABC transporter substrate-binding protein [Clostridia bacterium]
MKRTLLSMVLVIMMLSVLLTSCGQAPDTTKPDSSVSASSTDASTNEANAASATPADTQKPVKITYFNTSAEVNTMFENMFKKYHELFPNVTIELIPTAVGEGQQEKLQSLFAAGNGPTFMNVDPANVIQYQDKLFEMTMENAPWLAQASDGAVEGGTFGGKILGAPWSVQGYGLLYNKRVVDKVYGGAFDPATINTRDSLKAFLEKIEASGVPATMLHGANWSMGGHYLTLTYAVQGPKTTDGTGFIDKLKAGTAKIEDSPIFQGYMDTMDLLVEHNYNKADPLVGDFNKDVQAFGEGKAATFFMGDWTWTSMTTLKNVDQDYGFIPVPWSNNPADYGNTQIVMVLPKFQSIDKSQNTPEQTKAALDALGWMMTDPAGQQFFIDAGFFMPYKNVRTDVKYNSMTTAVADYAKNGKTINLGCFSYISGDAWTQTGNLMLKYISKAATRQELAQGIDDYWKTVK